MIRAVTPQDIKAVVRLFQGVQELHATYVPLAFRRPTDEEPTSAWLGPIIGNPNAYCLLAEKDGEAVGYLFAQEVRREESLIRPALRWLILEHVAVAPSFQRQGVGTALMKALFVECRGPKDRPHRVGGLEFQRTGTAILCSTRFRCVQSTNGS